MFFIVHSDINDVFKSFSNILKNWLETMSKTSHRLNTIKLKVWLWFLISNFINKLEALKIKITFYIS